MEESQEENQDGEDEPESEQDKDQDQEEEEEEEEEDQEEEEEEEEDQEEEDQQWAPNERDKACWILQYSSKEAVSLVSPLSEYILNKTYILPSSS